MFRNDFTRFLITLFLLVFSQMSGSVARKVLPLFKQGCRSELNNYRPISIIPNVAEVFEQIVYDQVMIYVANHNLISNYQSEFCGLNWSCSFSFQCNSFIRDW